MNDVAVAIDFYSRPVSLTPAATGAYVDGKWVPDASGPTTIRAAVFPISSSGSTSGSIGNQLKDAPEGVRTEAVWIMWSRSVIALDDRVTLDGVDYRVLWVTPRAFEGGYYRAALGRLTP